MSRRFNVKKAALGLVLGIGAGTGVGAFMYAAEYKAAPNITPEEAREKLSDAQEAAIAAPQNLLAIEQRIGEQCLSAMNSYRIDGVLGSTIEDQVVGDLLLNPAQPCGDNPTEIRANIVQLRSADEAASVAPSNVRSAEKDLKRAEENQQSVQNEDYLVAGAVTFGLTGAVIAGIHTPTERQ